MSDDGSDEKTDYEIGFKKPPKHSRFPPGVSGNPRGRPPGSKNKKGEAYYKTIDDLILSEAYREVELTENGERIKIPVVQAALRAAAVKAVQGNMRANIHLSKSVSEIERKRQENTDRQIETMINYKLDWEIESERCRKLGIDLPDLEIHPDDIIIDHQNGRAYIKEKLTNEQKEAIEKLTIRKVVHEKEIKIIQSMISDPTNTNIVDMLQKDLQRSKQIVNQLEKLVPK
jgi:hypothetical protein